MKKRYSLALLGLAATACQPHSTATQEVRVPAAATVPAGAPASPADTTAAVLDLLRQVDLTAAWRGARNAVMDGFYGPDNYRISFHTDSLWRDAQRPNVFHFRGRDRYKRTITPFIGTLTVTRLAPLPDTVGLEHRLGERAYLAFANFVLREDSTAKGSGHCVGRATLDFQVNAQNKSVEAGFDGMDLGWDNPTRGCDQIFRGIWQDNRTGQRKPVAWANFYGVIVPDVLRDMGLSERGDEVDPRLARYGWNTIMENDEWWASAPKPGLNM